MNEFLQFTDEVNEALENNRPVVALETTIISHGMPYPKNIETAKKAEAIIRDQGATPATIGIMDGQVKIGLNEEELEAFAKNDGVAKVSRRDFAYVLASGRMGATTVAATMIAAELAGIKVFSTGGIGGVHRHGEVSWDVSADLAELSHTNVAVVCAGAKSILDIGRTLEYLETQGVPIVGYACDAFPSFFARTSPYNVDFRLEAPDAVASVLDKKWKLGLDGGVVIANPVPEEAAMDYDAIEQVIQETIQEAEAQNISGKDVTPFVLERIQQKTNGQSLETNIALAFYNAEVAAKIAVSLATQ